MEEASIRKYAQLMKELDLTGLEVKENDVTVRLERTGAQEAAVRVSPLPAAPAAKSAPSEAPSGESVLSPMVGVFYAASAENAEPYVTVGDRVEKGDTLCIIEAMKLMNEITAERGGVVTEICARNGQVVEYGTPLFRIGD